MGSGSAGRAWSVWKGRGVARGLYQLSPHPGLNAIGSLISGVALHFLSTLHGQQRGVQTYDHEKYYYSTNSSISLLVMKVQLFTIRNLSVIVVDQTVTHVAAWKAWRLETVLSISPHSSIP